MRLAVLLFCCALAFGQNISSAPETQSQAPANSPDQKSQKQDYGLGTGATGPQMGDIDILSDTQGVDFRPYLQRIVQTVRENWYHLIPESVQYEKGELAIEFVIAKDGKVADMRLRSSGDLALDRPAWGSITASNPFPPLPSEFTGPYLALRFRFFYNPDKGDLTIWVRTVSPQTGLPQGQVLPLIGSTQTGSTHEKDCPAASGVAVCIDAPSDLEVPAGGSKIITASVGGTKEKDVDWLVECSGSACGKMTNDMYIAPIVRPNAPVVTLTAVSKADSTAKASITIYLVRPASQVPAKP